MQINANYVVKHLIRIFKNSFLNLQFIYIMKIKQYFQTKAQNQKITFKIRDIKQNNALQNNKNNNENITINQVSIT